jgi:hypothetical protein
MKERTKELADTVGAVYPHLFLGRHDGVVFTETELETFVELVAAVEREACAKVAEQFEPDEKTSYVMYASKAIRARGELK